MNRNQRRSAKKQRETGGSGAASIEELFGLALRHHQAGHLLEAEKLYRRIAVIDPAHAGSRHLSGVIAYQGGQQRRATILIESAIRTKSTVPTYHSSRGVVLYDQKRYKDSIDSYRKAVCLDPAFVDAWSNLGNTYNSISISGSAEAACLRALRIKPDFSEAFCNLGNALNDLERSEEAGAASRRALVLKPDYPEALSNLGNAAKSQRQYATAQPAYRRAVALKPYFPEAFSNLSAVLLSEGRLEEAAVSCRLAIALQPDFPAAYANLGMMMVELGWFPEALTTLTKVMSRMLATHTLPGLIANQKMSGQAQIVASDILICNWILGRLAAAIAAGNQLAPFIRLIGPGKKRNAGTYLRYLSSLLGYVQENPTLYDRTDAIPLYVVGESHSLAPANAHFNWCAERCVGRPLFLMGLKMHHLAPESGNYRRRILEERISRMPAQSHILMALGEIDCRPNEGIWHVHKTRDIPAKQLAEKTVVRYLDWLHVHVQKLYPKSLTIQGVPAPAYSLDELDGPGEKVAFLGLIRYVNALLKSGAFARGWSFLDVHAATSNDEGTSNRVWHIDSHHMSPSFYATSAPSYMSNVRRALP